VSGREGGREGRLARNRCRIAVGVSGSEDGMGKSWSRAVDCFSFSSLLCAAATSKSYLVIFFICNSLRVAREGGMGTYEVFFQGLVWSLRALWLGCGPRPMPQGRLGRQARPMP